MKKYILLIFISFFSSQYAQKVAFTGYGRAQVINSKLKGEAIKGDTLTPNKSTDGDMIFDLGMHFQPYDYFRAKALVRLKNQFGVFFGQGASVEFRQILVEGLIAQKVKYSLGDIDIIATPYTVFNNSDTSLFEAQIFKIRRNIAHYDNFNNDNQWRVQGLKSNAIFKIKNTNSFLNLEGFASRTKPTNYSTTPDRFLTGATLDGNIGENLKLGVNWVSFFEMSNQIDSGVYRNNVFTTTLKYNKVFKNTLLKFDSEIGMSNLKNDLNLDSVITMSDAFYDVKASVIFKKLQSKLSVGYKNVGSNFNSPAAQTLRIFATKNNNLFPLIENNAVQRSQLQFDRITDPSIYNQTINPTQMSYLPQYSNVLPYGAATPNRKGMYSKVEIGELSKPLFIVFEMSKYKEVKPDSNSFLRDYFLLNTGVNVNITELLSMKRKWQFSSSLKKEKTQREGLLPINLNSTQIDLGMSYEIFKKFDFLIGYKSIKSIGNEIVNIRNSENKINSSTTYLLNGMQSIFSLGACYHFNDKTFLSLVGNNIKYHNYSNSMQSISMSQFYISYILQF